MKINAQRAGNRQSTGDSKRMYSLKWDRCVNTRRSMDLACILYNIRNTQMFVERFVLLLKYHKRARVCAAGRVVLLVAMSCVFTSGLVRGRSPLSAAFCSINQLHTCANNC